MGTQKSRGLGRTRSWVCIVYPESAPDNWRTIIDDEHIQWVESPLHDKDLNEGTGEPKKPHWHLLLIYESVKTFEQVKELTDRLNCPIPQKANGAKGVVRYMAHLDNPDKAQYSVSDIIGHGGVDLDELLKVSASEQRAITREITAYIFEYNVFEYCDLIEYALHNNEKWFDVLASHTIYFKGVLSSLRYRHSSK